MSNLRIESVSSLSQDEVQVKTEPEDPGYDEAYNQSPVPADTNGHATPQHPPSNQNIRSILNNMLDQNKELTVKSVIDDLLQRNNTLLEQVDASIYKPQPRNMSSKKYDEIIKTKYGDQLSSRPLERSNILRPGSPTKACTIPKKDLPQMTHSVMVLNAMETSTAESNIPREYVCGVASKAYVMTNEGVNMQSDLQFYWCNFCTFKTESKEVLVQHVIEHRFHCKYCSYQSFSRADVIRHSNEDHDEFRDVARSLKFCTFTSDYHEAENFKKRKSDTEAKKQPPAKKFKSAAQKDKEKVEKRKRSESAKKNASKNEEEYDAFDMEVEEVEEEEEQEEEEEASDKILIPRQTGAVKPVAQPVEQSLPTVTYNPPGASKTTDQGKQTAGNVTSTSTTKSGSTVTVSSGLCWNCGYCDFVTLSQTFLKTHLNTRHTGKAHKYVAMLVSSQEEMNKIKERDAMVYSSPSTVLLGGPGRTSVQAPPTPPPPAPKANKESKAASPKPDNTSQAEESDDEEYIPEEEKKKYPLTYKCAHCNFNAPVCFKIKEHLLMKHLGCVLYALDMRAIKLKQRRYVFFCHRKNCSFTTKKTDEYLSHSDSCTPWLVENCPEQVDPQTRKCLEMTRSFSSKISQKAFQMAKNFKSNKVAEYACLYCSYSTNNNTRLKKHVLSNHREFATVMKDIHAHSMGKKTMVYFCKHCLWESRQENELEEHLRGKHDDFSYVNSSTGETSSAEKNKGQEPKKRAEKVNVQPASRTEMGRRSSSPAWESGNSDNVEENEEEEEEIQPEDLEVSEEEVQRMMDEYVKDEASHGRSPGRPMRKASAEASVRVRAQGHQPPMYRCMHCYHMCFGVNLMRKHIFTKHPKEPLRAIDVKKMMARQFAYYCFCPKALCKTVNSSEQQLINHAMQEHGLSDENEHLKALLMPFSPHTSTPAPPPVPIKTEEPESVEYEQPNTIGYECLFCNSATSDTVRGMKTHILEYHPSEEIIFRDCAARKLKKSSRIFMCEVDNCEIFYSEQKEFELHKLAHQNAHIYECTVCQWFTATPDSISDHMLALHRGGAATIEIQLHLDSEGQVIKRVSGTKIKQEPL